jgi:hypothetical protein
VTAYPTERAEVHALVLAFFNGDHEKTRLWMRTRNQLLGGLAPKDLIVLRPGKVLKWVKVQLSENERNPA